jgi:hypothetical protein
MRRLAVVLVAVGLLVAACGGGSSSLRGARTYYESLDLSTPSHAAATFVDAFGRNDFMTVWLVLSPGAQMEFRNDVNLLQYSEVVDTAAFADFGAVLETEFLPPTGWDSLDDWEVFDRLMLMADRHHALLIDLSGSVKITGTTTVPDSAYTDVAARVEGIDGEVILRTTQAPSGRWRLFQVILPGGDSNLIPWAVPASG